MCGDRWGRAFDRCRSGRTNGRDYQKFRGPTPEAWFQPKSGTDDPCGEPGNRPLVGGVSITTIRSLRTRSVGRVARECYVHFVRISRTSLSWGTARTPAVRSYESGIRCRRPAASQSRSPPPNNSESDRPSSHTVGCTSVKHIATSWSRNLEAVTASSISRKLFFGES
ncbi:hypothetical protein LC1Hm_2849 [Halomicrobium sp. LC1Hm]|nr:hypothetical protein LC1Hm_2849 [Halomicrobium sp. LC1Hm]